MKTKPMKKLFFILFATFSIVANAKNAVLKSASEVAPLSIGKKNSIFILKSSGNNRIILLCPKGEFVKEFEIDLKFPKTKSVINLHSCCSLISILKNLNKE
jgi:hypothetical protein